MFHLENYRTIKLTIGNVHSSANFNTGIDSCNQHHHQDAGQTELSPEKNSFVQRCINLKTILKEVILVSCDIHYCEILHFSQQMARGGAPITRIYITLDKLQVHFRNMVWTMF